MVNLGNSKNVIWEAFLLTIVIFVFGLLLGVAYEENKFEEISEYYIQSEVSLMDAMALNDVVSMKNSSCDVLIDANIEFADRIYEEARLLEKYESSGKITESLKLAHKKYDLLRTFLWITNIKTLDKCSGEFSTIVYLYEYESEDLVQKATQNVWSKILFDLKQEKGKNIILIPIAVDNGLSSLNSLISRFGVSEFPVVIINDKYIITELSSIDEIQKYLKSDSI